VRAASPGFLGDVRRVPAVTFRLTERDFPCSAGVEQGVAIARADRRRRDRQNDTIANPAWVMA
jgi:hypothetical protein